MKNISILGSGWLGLPLARHFVSEGYSVKASTTSEGRLPEIRSAGAESFLLNLNELNHTIKPFLDASILIVNIPSKNIAGFQQFVKEVDASAIEYAIFVSSTSVYKNVRRTITELDTNYFSDSPLLEIEELFQTCRSIKTTVVRFGGLIGYSRHPGRFFKPGRIVPNPDAPVNLIHRDDCIGIISQIVAQQVWGEVLNCCADTHLTKREFYSRAVESIGGILPEFGEADPTIGKTISNQKVKQVLNYSFKYPDLMKVEL